MKFEIREILEATGGKLIEKKEAKFGGISIDSRKIRKGELFIALKGKNFDGHNFVNEAFSKGAYGAIVEKKLKASGRTLIFVEDTLKALMDIASEVRKKKKVKVIFITGSCGKTTTREMIKWSLSPYFSVHSSMKNFNNLIGLPLTILSMPEETELLILEGGISKVGEMEKLAKISSPTISVITSIYPVHLEGLGSLKEIALEKSKVAKFTSDIIIYPEKAFYLKKLLKKYPLEKITFGLRKGDIKLKSLRFNDKYFPKFKIKDTEVKLNLPGYPPVYSALSTIGVSQILNLPIKDICERLSNFKGVEGRLQLIESGGITILNDTYNSNPYALMEMIKTIENIKSKGRKILAIGEMRELGKREEYYHKKIGERILYSSIDMVITTGKLTGFIYEKTKNKKESYITDSSEEASILLKKILRKNDFIGIKGSRALKMEKLVEDVLSFTLPA